MIPADLQSVGWWLGWASWAAAGVVALWGVWSVMRVIVGRRVTARADASGALTAGQRCPCCSYALDGLEAPVCPECGLTMDGRVFFGPRRSRSRRLVAGLAAFLLAGLLAAAPRAAREGVSSLVPDAALIVALPWTPTPDGPLHADLRGRIDRGEVTGFESRLLAERAASIAAGAREGASRVMALRFLGSCGREGLGSCDAAVASLDDPSADVRFAAVEAVEAVVCRGEATEALCRVATGDRSARVRRRAVDALARRDAGNPEVQRALAEAVSDPSPGVRERAVYALCREQIASSDLMDVLSAASRDRSDRVREAGVYALGRAAALRDDAVPAIACALSDRSREVRWLALASLTGLGERAVPALPALVSCLEDTDLDVQREAWAALHALLGARRSS